jgi:hypothetical protein
MEFEFYYHLRLFALLLALPSAYTRERRRECADAHRSGVLQEPDTENRLDMVLSN